MASTLTNEFSFWVRVEVFCSVVAEYRGWIRTGCQGDHLDIKGMSGHDDGENCINV